VRLQAGVVSRAEGTADHSSNSHFKTREQKVGRALMRTVSLWVRCIAILALGFCLGTFGRADAKEVAVIWDTKSAMPNNVALAFLPAARQLAPDLKVTLYRELKDFDEAKRVFHDCERNVDGIVFLRSSGAEFLGKITPKVPCFVGACNNPAELGTIKNLNAPEGMVTGVTYAIPYEKRFEIIRKLFPNIKSVAILVEKGHPSGPLEQAGTREQCERLGLVYKEVVASSLDALLDGTKNLGKVDLIIISNTRLVMDRVGSLLAITNAEKIPMFSYADKPVTLGAVAGMAADDAKLGMMLAESVVDVVVKGKPISQVPVKMDPNPKITVNEIMMKSLGLQFPDAILKEAILIKN
jgi:putative tryptophan/tyrosine transport system substrate-binding protein